MDSPLEEVRQTLGDELERPVHDQMHPIGAFGHDEGGAGGGRVDHGLKVEGPARVGSGGPVVGEPCVARAVAVRELPTGK